ncbi:MAG: hypothetical protein E7650_05130 [Ruminococcaceae bacterium]|nr:hypothetical protein [Oscillospiraceae bacterium]
MKKYDVAAFVWPSYTGDEPRTRMFWPKGEGEWQTVKEATKIYDEHEWPRKPLWGYVNEADPAVMEMQIEEAAKHGINVFLYDWYWYDNRPFLAQCLENGYMQARNNDKVKFYLMWANHTATTLWYKQLAHEDIPIWNGAVDKKTFAYIVALTIEKYFSYPSYYKIGGKPAYMIFSIPQFVKGLGGVDEALEALRYFREETKRAGFPGLSLQACIFNEKHRAEMLDEKTDVLDFIALAELDGVTYYNFENFAPMNRTYPEILEDVKREWHKIEQSVKAPFIPQVSLGWDNTLRFAVQQKKWLCYENTPENVEKGFRLARDYIDAHPEAEAPLVVVNSWNEWTEGSYLEPDDLNGYGYLEAAKRVFVDENI